MDPSENFLEDDMEDMDYSTYAPISEYPVGANVVYLNENQEAVYREEHGVFFEEFAGDKGFGYDDDYDVVDTQVRLETFPETACLRPCRSLTYKRGEPKMQLTVSFNSSVSRPVPVHTYDMHNTIELRIDRPKAEMVTGHLEEEQQPGTEQVKSSDHPEIVLTPLPDKYFVRRGTGSAASVGLQSIAAYCERCLFCFRTKTAHLKHMLLHEDEDPPMPLLPRTQLICPFPDCEIRSDCLATLIEHCRSFHEREELVFESIEFTDVNQFKKWKSEMERLTSSRFTRSSGKLNVFSKSTYYHCHQSGGPVTTKPTNVIRNRPSKKMGRCCTAFFHIKEKEDGKVLLRGCVQHVGHETSIRTIPLSEAIKKEIATYLLEGLNEHDIVDLLREESSTDDRRHYVQPYEVRNVHMKLVKHQYSVADAAADYLPEDGDEYEDDADLDLTNMQGTSASCQPKLQMGSSKMRKQQSMNLFGESSSSSSFATTEAVDPLVHQEPAVRKRKELPDCDLPPKKRRNRKNAVFEEPIQDNISGFVGGDLVDEKNILMTQPHMETFPETSILEPNPFQQVTVIRPEPIRGIDPMALDFVAKEERDYSVVVDFKSALALSASSVKIEESEGTSFKKVIPSRTLEDEKDFPLFQGL